MSLIFGVPPTNRVWRSSPEPHPGYHLAVRIRDIIGGYGDEPVWQTPDEAGQPNPRWDLTRSNDWFLHVLGPIGPGGETVYQLSGRALAGPSEFSQQLRQGFATLIPPLLGLVLIEPNQLQKTLL